MKSFFIGLVFAVLAFGANAFATAPEYSVRHWGFCHLNAAMELATLWDAGEQDLANERQMALVETGECVNAPQPMTVAIREVIARFEDRHGVFYVVRVGEEWYTWAWLGVNTNLPADQES